jgi:hypothetical protein
MSPLDIGARLDEAPTKRRRQGPCHSRTEAKRFADAMIKINLAERRISGLSMDLDEVFTGRIEVN